MFLVHTSPADAPLLARAVIAACRGDGWQSDLQPQLLHTLFNLVLQQDLNIEGLEPASRSEVAAALVSREARQELIQLMCAMEILCSKVPKDIEARVENWAEALDVEEPALLFLRDLALGQAAQAQHDFYRLNWIGDLDHRQPEFAALLERWDCLNLALLAAVISPSALNSRDYQSPAVWSVWQMPYCAAKLAMPTCWILIFFKSPINPSKRCALIFLSRQRVTPYFDSIPMASPIVK